MVESKPYDEFEAVITEVLCCFLFCFFPAQPPLGRVPSHEEQEQLNKQLERIHTLFRRQLAIPLMGEYRAAATLTEDFPSVSQSSFKAVESLIY